jgi:hypothetical protein
MLYNVRQPYTPALEFYEITERPLIIDTETIGKSAEVEIVDIAPGALRTVLASAHPFS